MQETFSSFGLNEGLLKSLKQEGIRTPTEIQGVVIPLALEGRDIIAQSETGSGKTFAYLLPLFEAMYRSETPGTALILVPSHELVHQVEHQIRLLNQNARLPTRCVTLLETENIDKQIEKLAVNPGLIVGIASRVLELLKKNKIDGGKVRAVILDEADRLMDVERSDATMAVVQSVRSDRQVMLFSASISQRSIDKIKPLLNSPEIIRGKNAGVPENIDHYYFLTAPKDKTETLKRLIFLLQPSKAMVFTSDTREIDTLASKLRHYGINAQSVHGQNKKLDQRLIIKDFREGRLDVLVASDIAARGLHIDDVSHVFSMEAPTDPKDYLHRSGRTGRVGRDGVSVLIVSEDEMPRVRNIEKAFKIRIEPQSLRKLTQLAERQRQNY